MTKVVMIEGHDYQDGEGTYWNKAHKFDGNMMLFQGTWELTNAKTGHTGRFTSGGLDWNNGSPLSDRPTNLVTDVTEPLEETELEVKELLKAVPIDKSLIPTGIYPHARYDELVQEIFDEVTKLGHLKGGEYAGDDDRLANFRRNGLDVGLDMEVVWRIYAGKHWDAISQYVKDLVTGKERTRLESIKGRATDLIVYMILFIAMTEEREWFSRN